MNDPELPLLDMIVLTVLFIAVLRGILIGLIREGSSLAAIGIATIVTRLLVDPFAIRIADWTGGEITGKTGVWIAGVLLVVATILILGFSARLIRRGAEAAGLGWADRLGGGALGAAEGAIVAAVIVTIALWLVGPNHATTDGARSIELVREFQSMREMGELPEVGSPGEWL
ncbi:MAG TPA: CvpA family protein [Myxococcales bacterium]|nr:CvpA family protein [Myxococcales bacterium]HIK85604.1 CvpA family protein [Myxococcales bacterium]